jgi:nickel/cobalt exporter
VQLTSNYQLSIVTCQLLIVHYPLSIVNYLSMFYLFADSLLLGIQHSFEPDHMAAVSVLASEKTDNKIKLHVLIWRSSQWALGHSVTLILFSCIALLLKSVLPLQISAYAEMAVGPVMIWLGISAIRRNHKLKKMMATHKVISAHEHLSNALHLHGKQGEEITMNPLSRSFWIGMLHGLAGTGGACAVALILASKNTATAVGVIMIQSFGIILAMTTYSCVLAFSVSRFIERNQVAFKFINAFVGVFSIFIGCLWIYKIIDNG